MTLSNGQILQDNYRIVSPLGHGGMGVVYLAEHTRLAGRRFAIKENIPEPNADPQTLSVLREQFYVEAKTLAALDHPNLPKVSDYFAVDDKEYLVMDFVEGENLQQVFDRHVQQFRTPLPEKSVLAWADQVLDALSHLHGQRPAPIIHRDIKPGNIILTPNGVVKLVDFGLVKLLGTGSQDTALALRGIGTPAYTALEQYPGAEGHTDARTDLYALGATLYHLLTGSPPANVRDRLLNPKALEKPRRLNPNLSAQTEAALLKAIEVHPNQRFQSASQMRVALGGKTGGPTAPGLPTTATAPARRRRWVLPVMMLALLIISGVATLAWFSRPVGVAPTPEPKATIVAKSPSGEPPPESTSSPETPVVEPTRDNTATIVPTTSPTDTDTPTAINTPKLTSTVEPTHTPTPSPTATPAVPRAEAVGDTNLRSGPGTNYSVVGSLPAGASAEITGRNEARTWLQLATRDGTRVWISAERVKATGPTDSVPVVAIPTPPATPIPARPGLIADFESGSAWPVGEQKYGQLVPSRDQVRVGLSAARLDYSFLAVTDNYVVFRAPRPIGIGGQPTGITAWVYGNGAGHFLNAWVQDSAGEVRAYTFGKVLHSGWQQMTAWFDDTRDWPNGHISGGDNGRLDYPARLFALVLDGVPDGVASNGVIYLDDLMATSATLPPAVTPTAVPTSPPGTTSRTALLPGTPDPAQTAGVGSLLGVGALLGVWLLGGRPRRRRP